MTAPRHPRQPVVLDAVGTARFKENTIVRHLLEYGGMDLNHLHTLDFSDADWEQFVQLIGYSVSGTANMEYMSDAVFTAACEETVALEDAPATPTPRPLNGCHNKPRPTASTAHVAQFGWREYEERGAPVRVPVLVHVPFRMSTTCQYDMSATDPGCAGCVHGQQAPNQGTI